jgi:RNA polymerase sigma-70 factor (ECF subfamily)
VEKIDWTGKDDSVLVTASKLGINEAFAELAHRYRRALWTVVTGLCKQRESVEDIVQDSLLIAFRSISRLRDGSRFGAWLYAIGRNRAIRYGSRLSREQIKPMDEIEAELFSRNGSNRRLTEDNQEALQIEEAVRMSLRNIDPEYATLFKLRYWVGMKVTDIARFLSLPESTVKWRFYQGRKKLRELLEHINQ